MKTCEACPRAHPATEADAKKPTRLTSNANSNIHKIHWGSIKISKKQINEAPVKYAKIIKRERIIANHDKSSMTLAAKRKPMRFVAFYLKTR